MQERKVYGPHHKWPRHGDLEWNRNLELARSKGWTLEKLEGHRFGKLRCPADECEFPTIDNSAKGTETFARQKRQIIERCRHRPDDQDSLIERIHGHLDSGDFLLKAVQNLLDRDAAQAEIEDLLAEIDSHTRRADELIIEDSVRAQNASAVSEQVAQDALESVGYEGEPEPLAVSEALESELADAGDALADLARKHPRYAAVSERLASLRSDADEARRQISHTSKGG